jgi:hypothetical protein
MKKLILLLALFSTSVFSQVLQPNSAERQQLIAMGAEILPDDTSKTSTHFILGSERFFIGKSSERVELGRAFRREKKLDPAQEFELHKLINKINIDQGFQFVLFENSIQANIFIYGNYDPRVLARIILSASKIENIFEANPKIFDLVNK